MMGFDSKFYPKINQIRFVKCVEEANMFKKPYVYLEIIDFKT